MLTFLTLITLGFALGMRHATDADHVVAVATIVGRERRLGAAALVGALWGLGHGVTVAAVGGMVILFGIAIPPRIGLATEFAVAIMLALLGLAALVPVWRDSGLAGQTDGAGPDEGAAHDHPAAATHSHVHRHGDFIHSHAHRHEPGGHGHGATPLDRLDARLRRLSWHQVLRPVAVGTVHGLAGSAAVALMVLATVPDGIWGLAYLLVFGLGTIAGMMMITLAIAVPFVAGANRAPRLNAGLRIASGLLSLMLGGVLMYQTGFVDGLFSAAPHWSPH